jgi:putative thioredoxin
MGPFFYHEDRQRAEIGDSRRRDDRRRAAREELQRDRPTMGDQTESSLWVIEATSENFQREVVQRSLEVPVVLDFWAEWCAPCRMLGPVLERLAAEYGGRFVLAKIDTEHEPGLASGFGVRSIPAVFAVRDGRAVDGFVGVQPEAAIRDWIDRLMPTPAERVVAEARRLEANDPRAAEAKYDLALSLDPDLLEAQIGVARTALANGRLEDAQARILDMERKSGYLEPEAERLKAEITLRLQGKEAGGSVEAARAALAQKPDDPELKFQLAEALAAAGQYGDALALCLDLVERHRKTPVGEQARQTMIAIFQLLPPESELVTEYQRQLSMVLMD